MKRDRSGKLWGAAAAEGRPNGVDEAMALMEINRLTLATCARMRITCFDLASELELNQSDFYDRVHTNPVGARKIGLYLHRKMKKLMAPSPGPCQPLAVLGRAGNYAEASGAAASAAAAAACFPTSF